MENFLDTALKLSRYIGSDLALGITYLARMNKLPEEVSMLLKMNKYEEISKIISENEKLREEIIRSSEDLLKGDNLQDLLDLSGTNALLLNLIRNAINRLYALARIAEDEAKARLSLISSRLDAIEGFVSYYESITSKMDMLSRLRLPKEWADDIVFKETFVIDDRVKNVFQEVLENLDKKVIIIGEPGVGKTALLYYIWRKISEFQDTALLLPNVSLRDVHERLGIVLFADDFPRYGDATFRSIIGRNMIIATAREFEFNDLLSKYPELRGEFHIVFLSKADENFLRNVLIRYLNNAEIPYDPDAVTLAVKKARGAPVYLWHLYKDLLSRKLRGEEVMLNIDVARRIPEGTREYVGEILARFLRNKPGRYSMMLTLKSMIFMRDAEIHDAHFGVLYTKASELLGDEMNWDLLIQVHDVLDFNSETMTLKFPHDSWIDVLRGRSGAVAGLIIAIDSRVNDAKKEALLMESGIEAWRRVIEEVKLLKKRTGRIEETDARKILSLLKTLLSTWNDITLPDIKFAENIAKEWRKELGEFANHVLELIMRMPKRMITSEDLYVEAKRNYYDGNLDKALEILNSALSDEPVNEKLNILKAVILFEKGEWESAKSILSKFDSGIALYNLSVIYLEEGDYTNAEKLLKKSISKGGPPEALWNLAYIYFKRGEISEAKKYLEKYLNQVPWDAKAKRLIKKL